MAQNPALPGLVDNEAASATASGPFNNTLTSQGFNVKKVYRRFTNEIRIE